MAWIVTTLLGFVVGVVATLAIYIAPPPYPYFDWEPYFDQLYAEEGCKGAEWFAAAAYLNGFVIEPGNRARHLVADGTCPNTRYDPAELNPAYIDGSTEHDPDGSIDEYFTYYPNFILSRIGEVIGGSLKNHDLFDTASRRAMIPDIIQFGLRCPKQESGREYLYVLRHRVAEWLDDEKLSMPAWERRMEECAGLVLNVAEHWEATENMPPHDRSGAVLVREIAYHMMIYGSNYWGEPLLREWLGWRFNAYASRTGDGLYLDRYCPTNWDDYADTYRIQMRRISQQSVYHRLHNSMRDDFFVELAALGDLQEIGGTLPRSDIWAYYWFKRSSDSGGDVARDVSHLAARIGPEEVARIEQLIAENRLPEVPSELLEMAMRDAAISYFSEIRDGSDTPYFDSQILLPKLRAEDVEFAERFADSGTWPEREFLRDQHPFDDLDWVDCETGEPPAWAQ